MYSGEKLFTQALNPTNERLFEKIEGKIKNMVVRKPCDESVERERSRQYRGVVGTGSGTGTGSEY